jgi:hypothetical protein
MTWKSIGQSIIGTSHVSAKTCCEDAIAYTTVTTNDEEILICCVSDGAGSAKFAAEASAMAAEEAMKQLSLSANRIGDLNESDIYAIAENIYDRLEAEAKTVSEPLYEFSCTLLGCLLSKNRSIFFQVGDGAIVKNNTGDFYTHVFWPNNGEYQNTTSFLVDDRNLANLKVVIAEERTDEVAMFTDGLQMLALNMETRAVHQPFFTDLFKYLRMADEPGKVATLNNKLADYLNSKQINDRTDDDKTLFLATRL